jgi:hypothetical protein
MTTFPPYIRTLDKDEQILSLTIRGLMLDEDQTKIKKYMTEVTPEELINVRRIIFCSHIF